MSADPRASRSTGFVYLASQSPRRRQLLDADRRAPRAAARRTPTRTPRRSKRSAPASCRRAYVERVTRAKLAAARRAARARAALPPAPILCADTTVALGRRILGKPADAADAARMLGAAVRPHATACITAVAVATAAQRGCARQRLARALRAAARRRDDRRLRRQRRAVRQGRRLRDPERAPRPGSRGSKAATPVSWVCRCTRRPRCSRWAGVDVRRVTEHESPTPTMQDILINWAPQETRVAVVENGAVQELHVERALERGLVGNIYIGKVARVLPGMQSAFIDIGLERAAFLHIADSARQRRRRAATTARRGAAAADRAAGLRGPDADRAGDQGPDRHQGRAAVDADQHRRAAAGLPAAGRPHRHLAEDRLARAARAAARAHDGAGRRPRTRRADGGEAGGGFILRTNAEEASDDELADDIALPAQDLDARCASAPSSRRRARCCTRT